MPKRHMRSSRGRQTQAYGTTPGAARLTASQMCSTPDKDTTEQNTSSRFSQAHAMCTQEVARPGDHRNSVEQRLHQHHQCIYAVLRARHPPSSARPAPPSLFNAHSMLYASTAEHQRWCSRPATATTRTWLYPVQQKNSLRQFASGDGCSCISIGISTSHATESTIRTVVAVTWYVASTWRQHGNVGPYQDAPSVDTHARKDSI